MTDNKKNSTSKKRTWQEEEDDVVVSEYDEDLESGHGASKPNQHPLQPVIPVPAKVKQMEDDDESDEDEDPPDPQFFLGAASTIGMACFIIFAFSFVTTFGQMSGVLVWIVTFCGGALAFLIPFFYYICTSKHFACCGKFGDGFFGAFPWLFVGMGVCYVYVVLGTAVRNVAGANIPTKILMYINVPLFMVAWLPLFIFLLHLQRGDAAAAEDHKRKLEGKKPLDPYRPKKPASGAKYMFLTFRRTIVAFVVSSCVTSYMMIPFYTLAWICVGLYMAWEIHIAIPICILAVTVIVAIIMGILCPKVARLPFVFLFKFISLPLVGWSPRAEGFMPKYDNSLTVDRQIALHNRNIEELRKKNEAGDVEGAKKAQAKVKESQRKLDNSRAMVVEDV